jgi:hypothetical protein
VQSEETLRTFVFTRCAAQLGGDFANKEDRMSHDAWNTLRALIHPGARPEISLVVGAGMHMQWQATTDREKSRQKILASWPGLLRALSAARAPEQMRESLVWETLLLRQLPPKPLARTFGVSIHRWQRMSAAEREKQLQKCAATKLLDAEDAVAKSGFRGMESVRRVLNSTAVSDIISLNADLTIERLIGGSDRPLRRYPLNRRGLAHFRLIPRSDGSAVRVWHIHGDRVRSDSLRFGLRHYATMVPEVERTRRATKSAERRLGISAMRKRSASSPASWIEAMLYRPIVFLGTSLGESEWDLWNALVDRQRNYAKWAHGAYNPGAWILADAKSEEGASGPWLARLKAATWERAWLQLAASLGDSTE